MGGIRNGLKLAKLGKKLHTNSTIPRESMVIFLTDGQPNSEESNPDKIVENIQELNNGYDFLKQYTSIEDITTKPAKCY